jgi:hypothetical protein
VTSDEQGDNSLQLVSHPPFTKVLTLRSRPSVLTVMVPLRPVVITCAPALCQRSMTSGLGCPKGEVRPTEMTASFGRVAWTNCSVEEVFTLLQEKNLLSTYMYV